MKKLDAFSPNRSLALQGSRSVSDSRLQREQALALTRRNSSPPAITNRQTDIDLPRQLWDAWTELGKARQLRRELLPEERALLEARKAEIEPWIVGYDAEERDHAALAIVEMFSGFRSMSAQSDQQIVATSEGLLRLLAAFPYWAIEKACLGLRLNGWTKSDGTRERNWPPSDADVIAAVRETTRLYSDQYDSASALLAAKVSS